MNTIKVDKENLELEDQIINLSINTEKLNLIVKKNVCIYDYNKTKSLELNIKVLDNSTLTYYMFSDNDFVSKKIKIDNLSKSKTKFNYSFINNKDCSLEINNNILENDINSYIKVRAVASNKSHIKIDSNGYVLKDTLNNEFNEDLRGLNIDDGEVKINPNMYIDSNDVIANHSSTIGNIDTDYLFYLNSKGIKDKDAKSLIVNGFINSVLDSEMINRR